MTTIYISNKYSKTLPERDPFDFYPTPPSFAACALDQLDGIERDLLTPKLQVRTILDPGAGTGVWGAAAKGRHPAAYLTGIELREVDVPDVFDEWRNDDFLRFQTDERYDLIVCNPPFRHAETFVRKALSLLDVDGIAMFLLRLNFLEGQARGEGLHREFPPYRVVVSSRRLSFTGDGATNATAYALFIWLRDWRGDTRLGWMMHDTNHHNESNAAKAQQMELFGGVS